MSGHLGEKCHPSSMAPCETELPRPRVQLCFSNSVLLCRAKTDLEKLHLLMLAQHKLRRFAPMRRVLPPVLDEAGRVTIDLRKHISTR